VANFHAVSYLLIHGGASTGRFWDRLAPCLDAPSLAVDMPGRNGKPGDLGTLSVDLEVTSIVADVERAGLPDPLVVVAHSSGGLDVPGVVQALGERVAHVVLSAALVPPEGGRGIDCMKEKHREGLVWAVQEAEKQGTPIITGGPPADRESFRTAYGGEPLDDETLAYMVDPVRCVRDTVHHYFQEIRWSGIAHVPVTYVLNELDRPLPADLQEKMTANLPNLADVVRLETGHIPAVIMPERFAAIVREASG
jgi:pimeloyl-ACP methyl ester carboxylesterase